MTDEQRVRTMAGWVGVELSRSRVRTPGKPGYGLYRVRGSFPVIWSIRDGAGIDRSPGQFEPTLWTAYAFTLEMIRICVVDAIRAGTPAGPGPLLPRAFGHGWSDPPDARIPTRWTSAYQGRRDLGLAGELELLERTDADVARASAGYDTMSETVRSRQRAANAAFQAEHAPRRAAGKAAYHARRLGSQTTGKPAAFKRSGDN